MPNAYFKKMDKSVNIPKTAFKDFDFFFKVENGILMGVLMLDDNSVYLDEFGEEGWGEIEVNDVQTTNKINEVFGTSFEANCEDGDL